MPCPKVLPLERLARAVALEKGRGRTVVLANGGFDLLHVGHIRYLQGAKALGDVRESPATGDDARDPVLARRLEHARE